MRLPILLAIAASLAWAQSPKDEPTQQEIERAYRSKSGRGSIRGWSLHFKRVSQERYVGVWRDKYQVLAQKDSLCAHYQITDTKPVPPPNVQIKPMLIVEADGVQVCR